MLQLDNVDTFYGPSQVLKNVSLTVNQGEIVVLLGANAAGKTTTMKTIVGFVRPTKGQVVFDGQRIDRTNTTDIVGRGLTLVPEGRRVFPRMTVLENLQMGAYQHGVPSQSSPELERVFTLFPRLKERIPQLAGTLSGGEQQMLAMGRALM